MSDFVPGELITDSDPININQGRDTTTVAVENTGDRPAQVGSHYHFFEVNPALEFPREQTYGMRLDIPAGTAVRFEPGTERDVELVAIGGSREVYGMGGLVDGELDSNNTKEVALKRAKEQGYLGAEL